MEQYIPKSALVAEIDKRITEGEKVVKELPSSAIMGLIQAYKNTLSFIDTLEVKEVQEPTASDRGMAEEIIINLKRLEQDYHINLTKEMEWLRSKAQKGEEV